MSRNEKCNVGIKKLNEDCNAKTYCRLVGKVYLDL